MAQSVRFVCAVGSGSHYEIKCKLLVFGSSYIIKPSVSSVPTHCMKMQDENVVAVQAYSQQEAAEMMALRAPNGGVSWLMDGNQTFWTTFQSRLQCTASTIGSLKKTTRTTLSLTPEQILIRTQIFKTQLA